jgi:hypothetical protein
MLYTRIIEPAAQGIEGVSPTGFGRFEPRVECKFREVTFLPQTAENSADLTDDQLEHGDFLLEQRKQLIFQCATCDEVEHEDLPILADAVDPANALLDRHRIPGHIEVDECIAELNIAALAAGFRAEQYRKVATACYEMPRNALKRFAMLRQE